MMHIVINMKHRFKGKKRIKYKGIKLIIVIIIIIISFLYTFKFLYTKIDINLTNEKYIDYLVKDSFGSFNMGDITRLSSVEFLLKYSFGIEKVDTGLIEKEVTTPIEIPEELPNADPIIYIYNSHQTEGYKSTFLDSFNINNTVLLASYILKEYLNDLGIASVVEENSIVDVLNANGWKYGYSYKASRILMEEAKKNNSSLNYFIDLHRDSASYERTMTEQDGVKYARLMFVVGLENPAYEANLKIANSLNDKIKEINPNLSRGVVEKQGKGVNGVYNQDFSPNGVLIEMGGQYNTIEEVNNTLKVLAKVLFTYIEEDLNETKEN